MNDAIPDDALTRLLGGRELHGKLCCLRCAGPLRGQTADGVDIHGDEPSVDVVNWWRCADCDVFISIDDVRLLAQRAVQPGDAFGQLLRVFAFMVLKEALRGDVALANEALQATLHGLAKTR